VACQHRRKFKPVQMLFTHMFYGASQAKLHWIFGKVFAIQGKFISYCLPQWAQD